MSRERDVVRGGQLADVTRGPRRRARGAHRHGARVRIFVRRGELLLVAADLGALLLAVDVPGLLAQDVEPAVAAHDALCDEGACLSAQPPRPDQWTI